MQLDVWRNDVKEREINLLDLIIEVLLKWRMIVIFMLIGGVVVGGYGYLQSVLEAKEEQRAIENEKNNLITLEELEQGLTDFQKSNVNIVLKAEESNENYNIYYDESLLMKMDAQQVPTIQMIFCVQSIDGKNVTNIVTTYTQLLKGGMTDWLVREGVNPEEASQINELLSIESYIGDATTAEEVQDTGSIYVTLRHVDETSCKVLAKQIEDFILSKKMTVAVYYGKHSIDVVSEIYSVVANSEIYERQRAILDNAEALKSSFSSKEAKYYYMLKLDIDVMKDGEIVLEEKETSQMSIVKMVCLGMLIFGAGYIFYVCLLYILDNKLRANDDFDEIYGIPAFGVISNVSVKKRFLSSVDKKILMLRDRHKRKFTAEEAKELATVAIKMAMKKAGKSRVSFVGCNINRKMGHICSDMKELLEEEAIQVDFLDNILYNAEELERLSDIQCAVIVEKAGDTMYSEVERELELLNRYNINVLGGVLVEE